jgi:hypothetical protein
MELKVVECSQLESLSSPDINDFLVLAGFSFIGGKRRSPILIAPMKTAEIAQAHWTFGSCNF